MYVHVFVNIDVNKISNNIDIILFKDLSISIFPEDNA